MGTCLSDKNTTQTYTSVTPQPSPEPKDPYEWIQDNEIKELVETIPITLDSLLVYKGRRHCLSSSKHHTFDNLVLDERSSLDLDIAYRSLGRLVITVRNHLILQESASISVNWVGYLGGKPTCQGESWKDGQGTKGVTVGKKYIDYGRGGDGSVYASGGRGGGIIVIQVGGYIVMNKSSRITADGQRGFFGSTNMNVCSGGGNGGSIYLYCYQLIMHEYASISAQGGRTGGSLDSFMEANGHCGYAGNVCIYVDGIECVDKIAKYGKEMNECMIRPKPKVRLRVDIVESYIQHRSHVNIPETLVSMIKLYCNISWVLPVKLHNGWR